MMSIWTIWPGSWSREDERAFKDEKRINEYFGFPYADVYSKSTNDQGLINVHDVKRGANPRTHYLSNILGIQRVEERFPDAKIWDEKYAWFEDIKDTRPYAEFIKAFGAGRVREVAELAIHRGIHRHPHGELIGKPDMAVYCPSEKLWRFIEVKRDRNRKREDWQEYQEDWLELLAKYLGKESAIELRLKEKPLGYG